MPWLSWTFTDKSCEWEFSRRDLFRLPVLMSAANRGWKSNQAASKSFICKNSFRGTLRNKNRPQQFFYKVSRNINIHLTYRLDYLICYYIRLVTLYIKILWFTFHLMCSKLFLVFMCCRGVWEKAYTDKIDGQDAL